MHWCRWCSRSPSPSLWPRGTHCEEIRRRCKFTLTSISQGFSSLCLSFSFAESCPCSVTSASNWLTPLLDTLTRTILQLTSATPSMFALRPRRSLRLLQLNSQARYDEIPWVNKITLMMTFDLLSFAVSSVHWCRWCPWGPAPSFRTWGEGGRRLHWGCKSKRVSQKLLNSF